MTNKCERSEHVNLDFIESFSKDKAISLLKTIYKNHLMIGEKYTIVHNLFNDLFIEGSIIEPLKINHALFDLYESIENLTEEELND